MNLNSTGNIHGILQGSTKLATDASSGGSCRTELHNGTLYCVYVNNQQHITYIMKPQYATWGTSIKLEPATVSENTPSLVSFNGTLWLIHTNTAGNTVFSAWDESKATFIYVREKTFEISQSASFAQVNDKLHMFYKLSTSSNIFSASTSDMETWSRPVMIKKDGTHSILTNISPVAITYQGLIHLIYKDKDGGFFLLKSDGEYWTSRIALIGADYHHSPGITVHNGLLKLVFTNFSSTPPFDLSQYSYDGSSLSPVVASTVLSAFNSPALSTQDGTLIATFMEPSSTVEYLTD